MVTMVRAVLALCSWEKKAAGDDHGQVCFVLARSISSPFVRQPAGRVPCALFFVGGPLHSTLLPCCFLFGRPSLAEALSSAPPSFHSLPFCSVVSNGWFISVLHATYSLINLIWVIWSLCFCIICIPQLRLFVRLSLFHTDESVYSLTRLTIHCSFPMGFELVLVKSVVHFRTPCFIRKKKLDVVKRTYLRGYLFGQISSFECI